MNLQHHFLIAMPSLQDPFFKRSVVYICEHNEEGAMGLIVNKPMDNLTVEGILKNLRSAHQNAILPSNWTNRCLPVAAGGRSWLYSALGPARVLLQYPHF